MLKPNAEYYRVIPPDQHNPDPAEIPHRTFVPRPKDNQQLSIHDAKLITPRECLNLYNQRTDIPPARAIAIITAEEVHQLGLTVTPQPTRQNPAHCVIDLKELQPKARQTATDLLTEFAESRGVILDP